MRVLLVNDWTTAEGGIENYVRRLRDGLRRLGDEARIVASAHGAADGRADHLVRGVGGRVGALGRVGDPLAAIDARRLVRSFRPDVVHVSMFEILLSPSVFLAFRGIRTVLNVGWYKPVCPTGHKLRPDGARCTEPMGAVCRSAGCLGAARHRFEQVRYAALHAAIRAADEVVVPSRWLQHELAALGHASTVVGRSVSGASPGYRRRPAPTPLLVYLGRLSPEKGVDDLLRAVALVEERGYDVALEVAGEGPAGRSTREQAARLRLRRTTFRGAVPHGEIDELLARAWALVVPSRWAEPYGNVIPEALARGVPVIATEGGGPSELIEHGSTGLLVRPGDVEALAVAVADVVRGATFPTRSIDELARAAVLARFDDGAHVRRIRTILAGDVRG